MLNKSNQSTPIKPTTYPRVPQRSNRTGQRTSQFPKSFPTTKSGDSAKSLAKISPFVATVPVAPSKESNILPSFRLYVYGGYQILNGSLGDFYSIDLNDNQPKFIWV
jgi:hypothetical protein